MRTSSRFTSDDNGYRNCSNYDDSDYNRASGSRRGPNNREYASRQPVLKAASDKKAPHGGADSLHPLDIIWPQDNRGTLFRQPLEFVSHEFHQRAHRFATEVEPASGLRKKFGQRT